MQPVLCFSEPFYLSPPPYICFHTRWYARLSYGVTPLTLITWIALKGSPRVYSFRDYQQAKYCNDQNGTSRDRRN